MTSKYIAFDMSKLHMNVNNQQVPINTIRIYRRTMIKTQTHYTKHLMPPEISKAFVRKILDMPQVDFNASKRDFKTSSKELVSISIAKSNCSQITK